MRDAEAAVGDVGGGAASTVGLAGNKNLPAVAGGLNGDAKPGCAAADDENVAVDFFG
jgi:hypothetical protein